MHFIVMFLTIVYLPMSLMGKKKMPISDSNKYFNVISKRVVKFINVLN